jgi:hypothetical protein
VINSRGGFALQNSATQQPDNSATCRSGNPTTGQPDNSFHNGAILGMKKREIDAKFDEIVALADEYSWLRKEAASGYSGIQLNLWGKFRGQLYDECRFNMKEDVR